MMRLTSFSDWIRVKFHRKSPISSFPDAKSKTKDREGHVRDL